MKNKYLWLALILVMAGSFALLLIYGREIYNEAPPIPDKVQSAGGEVLFTGQQIRDGQNVWQSIGGQEVGTIWGHGAYQAPDWNADWLHREAEALLSNLAQNAYQRAFDRLDEGQQASLLADLRKHMRTNTYDPSSGVITLSDERSAVVKELAGYYKGLFMDDPALADLRSFYAIPEMTIKDPERADLMAAFFFWSTWATVTERPGKEITYTNNWPHEPLVNNVPVTSHILWSVISVILLLLGIGILTAYYVSGKKEDGEMVLPAANPFAGLTLTPSMKATIKYFWIVSALFVVQILAGIITAHYGVEGTGFYGFPLADFLPYSVSRTWHVQLAIFWIATSWLATGLFFGPALSGKEPKYQKLGVNVLFGALIIVVGGSLVGQWLGVMQKLGLIENFWFGHQGYEYVDLGRLWQILLLIGLFLWLFLMLRSLLPALQRRDDSRPLLILFVISAIAIAGFYGAGLMWGRQTHLAMAEYWRWWVVHLWVEGFFEVFATAVIGLIFSRLGLISARLATGGVLLSTVIYLSGGILGTFHHLYFTGTTTSIMALGASFSALEVVPLVLFGFEAFHNYRLSKLTPWMQIYKWPVYYFIAVAFWNFLGAGIFGFLINPPIALYYMQGLNTTPVHGHTALFGVYGMLGIGLMLFVLRTATLKHEWSDKLHRWAFWGLNIGLLTMVFLSVLPVGIGQTIASMEHGLWYARSAEFLQQPAMETFRWLRVPGDIIFTLGVLVLVWLVWKPFMKKKQG